MRLPIAHTKSLALKLMQSVGIFALARTLSGDMPRVLMYHNFCEADDGDTGAVSLQALRKQLEHLRRHFKVVSLAYIGEQLASGGKLDRRMVALTIDDGRRNCYDFLFPLLKNYGMPATFFVVSSFIRGEDWIWTDKVLWLGAQPSRPKELDASNIDATFEALNRMRPEQRSRRILGIADAMNVSIPEKPPAEYAPCSWSELRAMSDSGLIEVGSHTVSHPILASLTDEESRRELTDSRQQIEQGLGRKVRWFCFPNGKPSDYRPSQVQQIREAGYTGAVVASFGLIKKQSCAFELPRIGVSNATSPVMFAKKMDGIEYFQAAVTER
jgi:peptidoglycan/xylan/chitin deacetylase (PgdA/CDA1 family)